MFQNKKLILFITKSKIRLIKVDISKIPKEETVAELEWTPSTLESALLKIKKLVKGKVKILLSEDFVYETLISLPKESQITQESVRQKAQGFIPEDLNQTVWTFKEIPARSAGGTKIQITAIVSSLFEPISKSIAKTEIEVDEIEPLSYALSRFTKEFEKPFLFVYVEDKAYLVLSQQEAVLATEQLENLNIKAVNQFVAFAKENLNVEIKNIIFCGKIQNINLAHYQNPNFKTEIQNISPAVSLAVKQKDVQPRDVLSLQLLKIIHNERQKTMQMQKTAIPKKWFSYFIPLVIGFIVVIGIAGVLTKDIQNRSKDNTSTPTIAFSPSKQPISSSAVNKSDYTIIVLNGSGKAGAATKTKELLENEGFNVVRIGNAENHNYKKTLVGFKKTVPSELILLLDKVLKSVYDFSTGTKLEKNSESDILIIIGKN